MSDLTPKQEEPAYAQRLRKVAENVRAKGDTQDADAMEKAIERMVREGVTQEDINSQIEEINEKIYKQQK